MAPRDVPVLVADRQFPPTLVAARLEYEPALARGHARQKAVLTAPWNTFGIPCLAHG